MAGIPAAKKMTYLELVDAIEELAIEAGCKSFWAGAKTANGINYDAGFPMCEFFNTQPRKFLSTVVRYNIGMGFYDADQHENGGEQTLAIQSKMDELVQRFERLLLESEYWEVQQDKDGGAIIAMPTIRTGTKIGTGIFVDFTIDVPRIC
jgi:hypothetical protein